jgi:hypothetical protein
VCWASPVCRCAASCSATFAQWTVGASRHPVFPAPSDEEGVRDEAKLGRLKPRGREAVAATQNGSCWRSSMPLAPSLRAQRSNPKSSMVGIWTASSQELLAMTWRERAPPPRSCARDAAQRSFSGALLSRSRCHSVCATSWLLAPGSWLPARRFACPGPSISSQIATRACKKSWSAAI